MTIDSKMIIIKAPIRTTRRMIMYRLKTLIMMPMIHITRKVSPEIKCTKPICIIGSSD